MLVSDSQNKRKKLLAHILWFVPEVARIAGVRRIALLGSMVSEKKNPKDIDFIVTVEDEADLEPLARSGRRLKGRSQGEMGGADIFLADVRGKYIGRTCSWRDCRPGIRVDCDALHCGRRQYLHDDLDAIRLSDEKVSGALELWPKVEQRDGLPADLERVLRRLGDLADQVSITAR